MYSSCGYRRTATPTVVGEVLNYLKPKIAEAVNSGIVKAVIDLHELKGLNMAVIKLLIQAMSKLPRSRAPIQSCRQRPDRLECKRLRRYEKLAVPRFDSGRQGQLQQVVASRGGRLSASSQLWTPSSNGVHPAKPRLTEARFIFFGGK